MKGLFNDPRCQPAPKAVARDAAGVAYALATELKPGDKVKAIPGFAAMKEGEIRTVHGWSDGVVWVTDAAGWNHHLDGYYRRQSDGEECEPYYYGFYIVKD
jgi:hypothetical protein